MPRTRLFPLLALTVLLVSLTSGCGILGGGEPTPDPLAFQATLNAAATEAVQTIQAQFTQTEQARPTEPFVPVPSATPQPTEPPTATPDYSPTPAPPTWTPVPIFTNTFTATATSNATATSTATPSPYSCAVVKVEPKAGTKLPYRNDFDARFTLKNNGSKDWLAANVDLKYASGEKMQKYADAVDLGKDVKPGEEYTFVVDMLAPENAGTYKATWNLVDSSTVYCSVTIEIVVTR